MLLVLFAVVGLACALPTAIDQSRLRPLEGAAMWMTVLTLRAVITVVIALTTFVVLPGTELFTALTHWCAQGAIPFLPAHAVIDGHSVGGLALLIPIVALGTSALWALAGIWGAAKNVRRWLGRSALGVGPRDSIIVGGSEPVVAAAGFRPARVVVSAGALMEMDDAELAASLEHEWGHVTRRHRFVLALAGVLHAVSRPLPGANSALRNLHFHLERDADEYAVRRTGDALALASAICKIAGAGGQPNRSPAFAFLGQTGVSERLRLLCSGPGVGMVRRPRSLPQLLIGAIATLALFVAVQAPVVWGDGIQQLNVAQAAHVEDC